MSAIAGVVRFDGAPAPAGLVERMTAAMAPRMSRPLWLNAKRTSPASAQRRISPAGIGVRDG